jgi:hypothetical protein
MKEEKKYSFLLHLWCFITIIVLILIVIIIFKLKEYTSRTIWFEKEIDDGKYIIEASFPPSAVHKDVWVTIKNQQGEIKYQFGQDLDYNVRMTDDYYELKEEKDYIKVRFKSNPKGIGTVYRIYYDDLEKNNNQ